MKRLSLRDMIKSYCSETPAVRPIGFRLKIADEDDWVQFCFPYIQRRGRSKRRKYIEDHFREFKPSGIEVIIWNQDVTELCMPIPI